MKVIIAGGRDFEPRPGDREWLAEQLRLYRATEVVSGRAHGADAFGEDVAKELGIPVIPFPANWTLYGRRRAGPIRNEQMACYGEMLIAFPGNSGTADMIARAEAHRLYVVRRD